MVKTTRILAVANQKGGVGKTTTCVNLGAAWVEEGNKVLLIDNDPQANLTSYLGGSSDYSASNSSSKATTDELYLEKRPPSLIDLKDKYLRSWQFSLDYIAGDAALNGVEHYLYARQQPESTLKRNLTAAIGEYDFILIDNPPSLNLLTINALTFADGILIPLQPEFFSLEGVLKMQSSLENVRSRWNPSLKIAGLVPTQVDQRKRLTREVIGLLERDFTDLLLTSHIRENSKIAESSGLKKPVLQYAPNSQGAEDYRRLATEVRIKFDNQFSNPTK